MMDGVVIVIDEMVRGLVKEAYLSTTTTGLSVLVTTMSVFQIMRAEHTIMPKFKPWSIS
jgi:hypothetical protein